MYTFSTRKTFLQRLLLLALIVAISTGFSPTATSASKVDPIRLLNSLPVSDEVTSGYNRELFRHWSDLDSDSCDTREEVLIDERVAGTVVGCKVVNGRWVSQYDGVTTTNSSNFDIDHFVPLKEAWDSGAWRWDSSTRERFANDQGYELSLIAVSASSNRSKSDRDPSDWLPSENLCLYAKSWVGVKFRWRLSVDSREKTKVRQLLANCKGSMKIPPIAQTTTGTNTVPSDSNTSSRPSNSATDPRFGTCGEAIASGYGPYTKGTDPEYFWYIDRDKDGSVCE
jgi:hypothetical protein